MRTKLILASLLLVGCAGKGNIRAEAIKVPLTSIVKDHKEYVEKDQTLTPLERRVRLRDGEVLMKVLAEAAPVTSE